MAPPSRRSSAAAAGRARSWTRRWTPQEEVKLSDIILEHVNLLKGFISKDATFKQKMKKMTIDPSTLIPRSSSHPFWTKCQRNLISIFCRNNHVSGNSTQYFSPSQICAKVRSLKRRFLMLIRGRAKHVRPWEQYTFSAWSQILDQNFLPPPGTYTAGSPKTRPGTASTHLRPHESQRPAVPGLSCSKEAAVGIKEKVAKADYTADQVQPDEEMEPEYDIHEEQDSGHEKADYEMNGAASGQGHDDQQKAYKEATGNMDHVDADGPEGVTDKGDYNPGADDPADGDNMTCDADGPEGVTDKGDNNHGADDPADDADNMTCDGECDFEAGAAADDPPNVHGARHQEYHHDNQSTRSGPKSGITILSPLELQTVKMVAIADLASAVKALAQEMSQF